MQSCEAAVEEGREKDNKCEIETDVPPRYLKNKVKALRMIQIVSRVVKQTMKLNLLQKFSKSDEDFLQCLEISSLGPK